MAIIERREIEFDAAGLLKAVASAAHVAAKFGLPALTAGGVVFHPEQGSVDLVFGTGSGARNVPLQAEVLGALLVFFCLGERVPLPRGAEKAVQVEPALVVLKFRSEIGRAPGAPREPPAPRAAAKPVQSMSWVTPGAV